MINRVRVWRTQTKILESKFITSCSSCLTTLKDCQFDQSIGWSDGSTTVHGIKLETFERHLRFFSWYWVCALCLKWNWKVKESNKSFKFKCIDQFFGLYDTLITVSIDLMRIGTCRQSWILKRIVNWRTHQVKFCWFFE